MAIGWEYILAYSEDMEEIGKMRNAHDRTLSVDLNKSGSAGGWIATASEVSGLIYPWSTCLKVQYTPADTREPLTFWSGPINSRQTDMAAGRVTFSAVGWFERLMHLNLQTRVTYTGVDAGEIAAKLLLEARLLDPRLPITMGPVVPTQPRTITYEVDQNIGQAIIDLANLESGYDWLIHPVTRQLEIHARRGAVLPNAKWTFIADRKKDADGNDILQLSEHSNLANVVENVDGSTLVNDVRARGKYGTGMATDAISQAQYGVFMEQPALSDVVDPNVLIAFANAEIVYRGQPRITYTLTPKPSTHPRALRLFRDFDIGDTTFLTARRDFIDVRDQAIRVFGVSLNISDQGVETISNLQTTAS